MSNSSKLRSKERRKQEKKNRKEMQKARYKAWASAGMNTKSKRFLSRSRGKTINMRRHPLGPCGNIGCSQCRSHAICKSDSSECGCGGVHTRKAA